MREALRQVMLSNNLQPWYDVASILHQLIEISHLPSLLKLINQVQLQVTKFIRDSHVWWQFRKTFINIIQLQSDALIPGPACITQAYNPVWKKVHV